MNLIVSGLHTRAAQLSMAATAVSAMALLLLHLLSPEFAPSWRAVSEYANGGYSWLLSVVFGGWAISSFALVVALWPLRDSRLGGVGLLFLALAGIGETMGALFDIHHPLHGPAAMIGIPSLCVAAVVLTRALRRAGVAAPPLWSAHFPWVSFLLMLGALGFFVASLKAAGATMVGQTTLPDGVVSYVGWANRLIFLASYVWTLFASRSLLGLSNSGGAVRLSSEGRASSPA